MTFKRNFFKRSLLILGSIMAASFIMGSSLSGAQTIADIKAKGKLTVGVMVGFPPFGFLDTNGQPDGYDPSLARMMANKMGVELELVQVSGANRIPYLLTNKVDVVIAALGITAERAKQVDFSDPSAVVQNVLYAPKTLTLKSLEDLKGKRVSVPRGSAEDVVLTRDAPKEIILQRFEDMPAVIQSLLSGQADAIVTSTLIIAERGKKEEFSGYEIKFPVQQLVHGIAVRKGETELQTWINTFLAEAKSSGELNALHKKWTGFDFIDVKKPDL